MNANLLRFYYLLFIFIVITSFFFYDSLNGLLYTYIIIINIITYYYYYYYCIYCNVISPLNLIIITIIFKPSTQPRRLFYRSNNYNTMLSISELLPGNLNYNVISDSACTIRVFFMFEISYFTTF